MINEKSAGTECPRCNKPEMWEHVVECRKVRSLQREFIKKMAQDLFRVNENRIHEDIILNMLEDIVIFFDNGEEDEFETS